jgi:organic hydroperoxide reductase OsmC/OhrA
VTIRQPSCQRSATSGKNDSTHLQCPQAAASNQLLVAVDQLLVAAHQVCHCSHLLQLSLRHNVESVQERGILHVNNKCSLSHGTCAVVNDKCSLSHVTCAVATFLA